MRGLYRVQSEMDTAKEQQATVLRIAERTLALPLGRAMFTFGTVPAVSREVRHLIMVVGQKKGG